MGYARYFIGKALINLLQIPGWHTRRKIVVFESDDWGSIRMPSSAAYDFLLKVGVRVDRNHYSRFDCVESEDDYYELFNVLRSEKDSIGNCPVFTLNYVAANPDFIKIREDDYRSYHYESVFETYRRYPNSKNNVRIIKEGINEGLILPQSHNREHLNVSQWISALQNEEPLARLGFDHEMFALPLLVNGIFKNMYVDALYNSSENETQIIIKTVIDGLRLFKEQWGFHSKSFMAPGYIWNTSVEDCLYTQGVDYIQGVAIQLVPSHIIGVRFKKKYHYTGQHNVNNQVFLVRNSFFEPSENPQKNWVNSCLREISNAFRFHKPAIIQSHRVNYIGNLSKSNRDVNTRLLKTLLGEIRKRWPDVEYMSTVQLGDLIKGNNPYSISNP